MFFNLKRFLFLKYKFLKNKAGIILIGLIFLIEMFVFEINIQAIETENTFILEKNIPSGVIIQANSFLSRTSPLLSNDSIFKKDFNKKDLVLVTAYSSDEDQTDDNPFITARGTETRDGVVANNLLPFGTKIRFPEIFGEKIFIIEDRMHWKKDFYHFDIWMENKEKAIDFGVTTTKIEILNNDSFF